MAISDEDRQFLARAFELARRGEGFVEPNPLVGCVVIQGGQVVGEGWHRRFGGPHAEIEALAAAGDAARGATACVSLEPCCHQGKTPPCVGALLAARVARVVVGAEDPNPVVSGKGIAALRAAGIAVDLADDCDEAAALVAPFRKLITTGRPWMIAKWAMTLDGKIAAIDGSSQWITGPEARAAVHALRGRVDAIVVGRGTVERDDPLLTARPAGARTATRIVLDAGANLPLTSKLARTAGEAPVLVAAASDAPAERVAALRSRRIEVLLLPGADRGARLETLLNELGRRQTTNVLVEGGSAVLGSLLACGAIDEVFAFVAPKLLGGAAAPGPVGGPGLATIAHAVPLKRLELSCLGPDLLLRGHVAPGVCAR